MTFDVDKNAKLRIIRSTVRGERSDRNHRILEFPTNHQSACSHASPSEWFWCSMNVNGFTHKPTRTRTVRLFRLVLAGALILGVQPLQAATTKRFVLTPAEAKTFEAWTKFLAEGTPTWSTTHAPAFTPAIESTIWQVLKTDTAAQSICQSDDRVSGVASQSGSDPVHRLPPESLTRPGAVIELSFSSSEPSSAHRHSGS